jgi:hypothetical protein
MLAVQFGHATRGGQVALRDAIGTMDPTTHEWKKAEKPTPKAYLETEEPHARGAILVAAVFSAFLRLYGVRRDDLVRIATNGTGVLPAGDIPLALAGRLADEASKVASHVLNICIRALDYCPPVNLTFGDYLRALITADRDLVPNDRHGYRVAFVAAFRERGIYPSGVKNLSTETLVWEPPPIPLRNVEGIVKSLSLAWDMRIDRRMAWNRSRKNARLFRDWLVGDEVSDDERAALGVLKVGADESYTLDRNTGELVPGHHEERGIIGRLSGVWVHSVRPARRVGPDGQSQSDVVVNITQTFTPKGGIGLPFRGGCTLLIDKEKALAGSKHAQDAVRYFVRKRLDSAERVSEREKAALALDDVYPNPYRDPLTAREPFALLHRDGGASSGGLERTA